MIGKKDCDLGHLIQVIHFISALLKIVYEISSHVNSQYYQLLVGLPIVG